MEVSIACLVMETWQVGWLVLENDLIKWLRQRFMVTHPLIKRSYRVPGCLVTSVWGTVVLDKRWCWLSIDRDLSEDIE